MTQPESAELWPTGKGPVAIIKVVLTLIGAAALAYAFAMGITPSRSPEHWGQFGDYWNGLLSPFIGLATLIAVVRSVQQNQRLLSYTATQLSHAEKSLTEDSESRRTEEAYRRSEFHLSGATRGIEAALRLLDDGNNERTTWIAAARILERAIRISQGITHPSHRALYEIDLERFRRSMGSILGYDNPNRPGGFFYGSPRNMRNANLDDAAVYKDPYRAGLARGATNIPPDVLWILWNFAEYPPGYEDPIGENGFTSANLDSPNMRLWPGLRAYLNHWRQFVVIGNQLHPRPPPA